MNIRKLPLAFATVLAAIAVSILPTGPVTEAHGGWSGTTRILFGPELPGWLWHSAWHSNENGVYWALDTSGPGAGTGVALYTVSDVQIWVDYWAHDGYCKGLDMPYWDHNGWIKLGEIHYVHIDLDIPLNWDEYLPTGFYARHLGAIAGSENWECWVRGYWDSPHLHQSGGQDYDDLHHVDVNWGVPNPLNAEDFDHWLHTIHG